MRSLSLALVLTLSFAGPALAQRAPLERAAWLVGCWELRANNRVTTERWMAASGNTMLGSSRSLVDGAVRETESLRITARGDTLVYTAIPSGQRETDFTGKAGGESPLVFENLQHDFPQRIIYRRVSADSLVARIEGPGPDNTTRGIDFPMRKVSCTADAAARPF